MVNYTSKYTKISSGYMGQLVEWPEVVTEGKDLEECRAVCCRQIFCFVYHWSDSPVYPHTPVLGELTTGKNISSPHS